MGRVDSGGHEEEGRGRGRGVLGMQWGIQRNCLIACGGEGVLCHRELEAQMGMARV